MAALLPAEVAVDVLQTLRGAKVDAAFACRRELISIKKLLLHQFAAGRVASVDAARAVTFFWFTDFKQHVGSVDGHADAGAGAPAGGGEDAKTGGHDRWSQTPRYAALASRLSRVKAATQVRISTRRAAPVCNPRPLTALT